MIIFHNLLTFFSNQSKLINTFFKYSFQTILNVIWRDLQVTGKKNNNKTTTAYRLNDLQIKAQQMCISHIS